MFTAWLTNVPAPPIGLKEYATEQEAIEAGKLTGFEFQVYYDNELVGYYTTFGGYHTISEPYIDENKLMSDMQCTNI